MDQEEKRISFVDGILLVQPIMFVIDIVIVWPLLRGSTFVGMIHRALILTTIGVLLLFGPIWKRWPTPPFWLMQLTIGLVLAPVYITLAALVFAAFK